MTIAQQHLERKYKHTFILHDNYDVVVSSRSYTAIEKLLTKYKVPNNITKIRTGDVSNTYYKRIKENIPHDDTYKPEELEPHSSTYFLNWLTKLEVQVEQVKHADSPMRQECKIILTSWFSRRIIQEFEQTLYRCYKDGKEEISKEYNFVHYENGHMFIQKKKIPMSSVVTNNYVVEQVVDRVKEFMANEAEYVRLGTNYKLAILLHGPPGTGKSKAVSAIAAYLNRNIVLTEPSIITRYRTSSPENMYVIEELDTYFSKREEDEQHDDSEQDDKKTTDTAEKKFGNRMLGEFLCKLDGIATPHGLVVIMTTNHIERLDHALIRPGRMDMIIEVSPPTADTVRRYLAMFYRLEQNEVVLLTLDDSVEVPSMALVEQVCLLNRNNITNAIEQLNKLTKDNRITKD
jgi:ATP-dependent Zn protease